MVKDKTAFESIMTGLNQALEYQKGNLAARTTTIVCDDSPEHNIVSFNTHYGKKEKEGK